MKLLFFSFFLLIQFNSFSQKNDSGFLIPFADTSSGKELFGFINSNNEIIITPKYQHVITEKMYDIAFVLYNEKWVVINRRESVILTPFIYDNGPDYIQEGLFRYVENNKIGFADKHGKIVIKAMFDFAEPFRNGKAAFNNGGHLETDAEGHSVWTGGSWGVINKKGSIIKLQDNKKSKK